jgi:hypothetical protein
MNQATTSKKKVSLKKLSTKSFVEADSFLGTWNLERWPATKAIVLNKNSSPFNNDTIHPERDPSNSKFSVDYDNIYGNAKVGRILVIFSGL